MKEKRSEWTKERDARLIELIKQEPTVGKAAEKMGVSVYAASKRLCRLGLHKRLLQRKEKSHVA